MRQNPYHSRRQFLEASVATFAAASIPEFLFSPVASASATHVIAGALRWDAWSKRADVSLAAQSSLSSKRYYKRAPFYCSVTPKPEVSCTGGAAEMDAEIKAAAKGGLKYWAFDWYAPESSLRTAWDIYQKSSFRNLINWCGVVGLPTLGSLPFSSNKWQANVREWVEYMRQPNYQKVDVDAPNRPLLYLFWDDSQLKYYFDNDLANVRKCVAYLTEMLHNLHVGAPYIVILDSTAGAPIARALGGAISNYISGFRHEEAGAYIDLDKQAQDYWKTLAAAKVPVVPIAMVGWDTRARQEKPGPWGPHGTTPAPNPNPTQYYSLATPSEFAAHVQAAVKFIDTHPSVCPSKVLLIYSWDECDEGGALIPTIGDPEGAYLSAIAPIISR